MVYLKWKGANYRSSILAKDRDVTRTKVEDIALTQWVASLPN